MTPSSRNAFLAGFRIAGLAACVLLLQGCYTPFIETGTEIHDSYGRDAYQSKAAAGNKAAQYDLGSSYCCEGGGPLDRISVYDNAKATHWFCRAARGGYGPAQLRLAQLYAGHPVHGIRIAQHISAAIGASPTDLAVALMWARVAADHAVEDADTLRAEITAQATPRERARAAELMSNWRSAPCGWSEVFPSARSTQK